MRLFVALDLPDAVRQQLASLIVQLSAAEGEARHRTALHGPATRSAVLHDAPRRQRWVRSGAMHVTLKFIGAATDETLPEIRGALASIRSSAPIDLHYTGIGFFPNSRRPRVLWAGVESSPNLSQLAADIELALEPLGIAREPRAFTPHLTLARFDSSDHRKLVRAAGEIKKRDFGAARETNFHLYESILKPDGAEYKKLETYSFAKDACAT